MAELSVIRVVASLVLLALGVALLLLAGFGGRQALPRNRWFGIRTPAAMRSEQAFRVANLAAAPAFAAAGALLALAFPLTLLLQRAALVVALSVCVAGAVIIAATGGVLGHRAAERQQDTERGPGGHGACQADSQQRGGDEVEGGAAERAQRCALCTHACQLSGAHPSASN